MGGRHEVFAGERRRRDRKEGHCATEKSRDGVAGDFNLAGKRLDREGVTASERAMARLSSVWNENGQ